MLAESPGAVDCWGSCQGCIHGELSCQQLLPVPAQGVIFSRVRALLPWKQSADSPHMASDDGFKLKCSCKAALKHSKMRASARGAAAEEPGCGIPNSPSHLLIKCVSGLSARPEVNWKGNRRPSAGSCSWGPDQSLLWRAGREQSSCKCSPKVTFLEASKPRVDFLSRGIID